MIYVNSDGGARGNPGPGAIGVVIRNEGQILTVHSEFIGMNVTNNIAEYKALIKALELTSKFGDEITCILDSELVIKQLLGKYKVRNQKLLKLFLEVQKLQDNFKKIHYLHNSRWNQFQQMADELVNRELEKRGFRKYKNEI
ncbi:MAG: ribonuclease HI family protein [archaeon]